jgi:hypothetical protein
LNLYLYIVYIDIMDTNINIDMLPLNQGSIHPLSATNVDMKMNHVDSIADGVEGQVVGSIADGVDGQVVGTPIVEGQVVGTPIIDGTDTRIVVANPEKKKKKKRRGKKKKSQIQQEVEVEPIYSPVDDSGRYININHESWKMIEKPHKYNLGNLSNRKNDIERDVGSARVFLKLMLKQAKIINALQIQQDGEEEPKLVMRPLEDRHRDFAEFINESEYKDFAKTHMCPTASILRTALGDLCFNGQKYSERCFRIYLLHYYATLLIPGSIDRGEVRLAAVREANATYNILLMIEQANIDGVHVDIAKVRLAKNLEVEKVGEMFKRERAYREKLEKEQKMAKLENYDNIKKLVIDRLIQRNMMPTSNGKKDVTEV